MDPPLDRSMDTSTDIDLPTNNKAASHDAPKSTESEQVLLTQLNILEEHENQQQKRKQKLLQQKPKQKQQIQKRQKKDQQDQKSNKSSSSKDSEDGELTKDSPKKSHRRQQMQGIVNTSNGDVLSLDQILEEARIIEDLSTSQDTVIASGSVDIVTTAASTSTILKNEVTNMNAKTSQAGSDYESSEDEAVNAGDDEPKDQISTVFPADDSNPHNVELINRIRRKRTRTVTSSYQARVLRKVLSQTSFPSTEMRENLAKALNMSPRTVQIWFQNQRQKAKLRQSTQSDALGGSNIFFHNLTVLPSHHGPSQDRPSTQVTLDKILPPTTENPSKPSLDSANNKKRRVPSIPMSSTASSSSPTSSSSPPSSSSSTSIPAVVRPTATTKSLTSKHGPGRPPKKQHPPQFIMTTSGKDVAMPQHYQRSTPTETTTTGAAADGVQIYPDQPFFLPRGLGDLTLSPWEAATGLANLQGLPQNFAGTFTTPTPAAAVAEAVTQPVAASTDTQFNYMLVPELDLLASAALEDQESGLSGQSPAPADGNKKKRKQSQEKAEGHTESTESSCEKVEEVRTELRGW